MRTLMAITAVLAGSVSATAAPPPSIDVQRLSTITRTLASDAFEGRAPGTPGGARTVAYLCAQFEALGLEPGGVDGSWTQDVAMLRTKVDMSAPLMVEKPGDSITLAQGKDVYVSTLRDTTRARIASAPLVFIGYGVDASERNWDDFKGADLKGKVLVFLVNDPDFDAAPGDPVADRFGGRAMTYYGRWSYKFEEAVRQGAVGALIVHETEAAGYGWNTITSPGGENYDLMGTEGGNGRLALQGWLSAEASERLFAAAGLDFAALKRRARTSDFRPVPFEKMSLSADVPVEVEHIMSKNVLAKITGTTRPDQTISFAAHWDAYGRDSKTGAIRPGALDDAIGVAGVLEIARLFRQAKPPERTVLFAAWTAEERGLLGSEQFARSGLYPIDHMVANFTLDVLQPNGPARDVVLIGKGQSTLEDDLASAAREQGRTVTPDAKPERGLFYRADHFSFAKRGVPTLLFMAIGGGVDLVEGGRARSDQWVSDFTAKCYHQACDTWRDDWDLHGAADDIALAYDIGRDLANSEDWPRWKADSEFSNLRPARSD